VDVGVDADVVRALERQDQHQVRGLAADAGQGEEVGHRAGHPAAVPVDQDPAGLLDVPCLVAVKAHRID